MRKTWILALALALAAPARASVSTTASSAGPYVCGSGTAFAVPFPYHSASHLLVTRKETATGAETHLVVGADYAVAPGSGASGTVTLVSGAKCADGYTLTIKRIVPLTQPTALSTQGGYSPAAIAAALDRGVMQAQQLDRVLQEIRQVDPTAGAIAARDAAQLSAGAASGSAAAAAGSAATASASSASAATSSAAAGTARSAAEAARDASAVAGRMYPDTASGIAGAADGDYFSVPSSASNESLILYRRSGAAAVYVTTYPSTNSLTAVTQILGRPPSATLVTGTTIDAAAYVSATPIAASGTLDKIDLYSKGTGSITVAAYTLSGGTLTRQRSVTVPVGATGLVTLTTAAVGAFNVNAGEYLGFYGANGVVAFLNPSTADGSWWFPSSGSGGAAGTAYTSYQFQVRFSLRSQIVNGDTFSTTATTATSAQATAAATSTSLMSDTAQIVGRPTSAALVTGSAIDTATYVSQTPIATSGQLKKVEVYALATGSITVATYSLSGGTLTRTGSVAVPIGSTGAVTVTDSTFGTLNLNAGEYLGFYGASGIVAFLGSTTADGSWWFASSNSGGTAGASYTSYQFQVRWTLRGQSVTAATFDSLKSSVTALSSSSTQRYAALGDSITAGYGATGSVSYSDLAKQTLGFPGYQKLAASGVTCMPLAGRGELYTQVAGVAAGTDVVTVMIGVNDAINNQPLGDVTAVLAKAYASLDRTLSFAEAFRYSLETLKRNLPAARIYVLLPIQTAYGTAIPQIQSYRDVEASIAKALAVPAIPMHEVGGFWVKAAGITYLDDLLHPNDAGQALLGKYVAKLIRE